LNAELNAEDLDERLLDRSGVVLEELKETRYRLPIVRNAPLQ
jgi:hypothetical protein